MYHEWQREGPRRKIKWRRSEEVRVEQRHEREEGRRQACAWDPALPAGDTDCKGLGGLSLECRRTARSPIHVPRAGRGGWEVEGQTCRALGTILGPRLLPWLGLLGVRTEE